MNCIYLKQKLNRTLECKKKQKIINIKECNSCKYKEYKMHVCVPKNNKTQKRANLHLRKKCTEFLKNSANSTLKNSTLHNKSAKPTNCHTSKKIRQKTSKLAKLERSRFSLFTDDLEHCIICKRKKEHLHEIFFGSNRKKSMQYNFVIPLCSTCHSEMHRNKEWQEYWHVKGQEYWERSVGTREEFIRVFGRSYLK